MSFTDWLAKQQDRDDPIGDLAKDFEVERARPKRYRFGLLEDFVAHLHAHNASHEAIVAARSAWSEWSKTREKA